MKKIVYLQGNIYSEETMNPFEKVVYEKLDELLDHHLKGQITLEQATKYMEFLKSVQPFMNDEEG
ncbi:hypothetical protein C2I17_21105 [Niallia circulans]|uniref:hypothetical protein n=1 Tax=Niallia circulans TaxID=1397 RepID=UPI00201E10F6|nr:hypothetical protein [Niallia circulans]UQZ76840.1 hypothetical protein C2I17_21105 [Niallia circulans]